MGCRNIQKKMPQYVQRLLSVTEALCIDEHVRTCTACRDELAGLQIIWNALEDLPEPETAASMAPEVLQRIEYYEQKRSGTFRSWFGVLQPSFASAVAAIMITGLLGGALLSSVYYPADDQAQTDADTVYAELLSDAPPASFFDLYLQSAGQNNKENTL